MTIIKNIKRVKNVIIIVTVYIAIFIAEVTD